jgi:formylglycine-generating enzyme required for sulfatase activity
VIVVPANPPGAAEMPAPPVAKTEPGKADIVPQGLPQRILPPGFEPKAEAGYHESGWPLLIVGQRDHGSMVLVPGGTFIMGSDRGETNEAPAHTVRMSTFYIDQYEVTNRQFRTFLGETHYQGDKQPGKWLTDEKLRDAPASAPANYVDYRDADRYAIWAGKRLATEAQWEMAARSGDGRRYPWGDQPIQWSRPRAFQQIDLVMSFSEDISPYGAFDMAGNAMEWVRDWYDPKYFEKMRGKIVENPTGPLSHSFRSIQRVVKGGSRNWIVSARQGLDVDRRLSYLSFRCSLAVEGPEAAVGINPHPEKEKKPGTAPVTDAPAGQTVPF